MLKSILWLLLLIAIISCHPKSTPLVEAPKSNIKLAIYPVKSVSDSIHLFFSNSVSSGVYKNTNAFQDLKNLYSKNNYIPLWKNDSLIKQGISILKRAKEHGLDPENYYLNYIDSLYTNLQEDSANKINTLAELDIAISGGAMLLSSHLLNGKLVPQNYHAAWNYPYSKPIKIDTMLLFLINNNRVMEIENAFQPKSLAYRALKKELIGLNKLQNSGIEYGLIEYPGLILRQGDSNQYVLKLKHELQIRGYYLEDSLSIVFDSKLVNAIKAFQKKHGLIADGVPGINTYTYLNWTLEKYIQTLRVNMERLRWLSDSMPKKYMSVNIPASQLKLYSDNKLLFNSRVIVGKYKNQTPVFESKIDYLVFNPCWTIPNSIANDKILTRIKKDTTYIDKHNMFISLNGKTQDHSSIDFSQYNKTNFPYKIFQRTGNGNALGKVKFMFDNNYSIYLHDTPGKSLFGRDSRASSHGCVRVQHALKLSEIVLHTLDNNYRPLSYYLDKGYPEKVYLNTEIALQLNYFTCDYNTETRQVQFFNDLYAIDYKIYRDLIE